MIPEDMGNSEERCASGEQKQGDEIPKESPARTTRASFPACGSSMITDSDLRELADRSLSGPPA